LFDFWRLASSSSSSSSSSCCCPFFIVMVNSSLHPYRAYWSQLKFIGFASLVVDSASSLYLLLGPPYAFFLIHGGCTPSRCSPSRCSMKCARHLYLFLDASQIFASQMFLRSLCLDLIWRLLILQSLLWTRPSVWSFCWCQSYYVVVSIVIHVCASVGALERVLLEIYPS
jgi:hypothetical protein